MKKRPLMKTRKQDAVWEAESRDGAATSQTKRIIDLSAVGTLQDSTLIDLVIGKIFDQLGQSPVELRIHPGAAERSEPQSDEAG